MVDIAGMNWLAVLVAGVVSFVLGGLWYTVLSKPWMAYTGITEEQTTAGGAGKMAGTYGAAFLTYLIAMAALGLLVQATGANDAGQGLLLGLLVGLGIVATVSFNNYMFSMRPFKLYLIDIGYPVTALAIAGVILGVWQ